MKPDLKLRDDQLEDLTSLIREPRYLLLNDPGTGKTPPVCVYAYWLWREKQQVMLWAMPNSLLEKNRDELLDWTPFTEDEVVILFDDHAPLTKKWTGPTFERTRRNGTKVLEKDLIAAAAPNAKVILCGITFFAMHWDRLTRAHPVGCIAIDEFHMGFSTADTRNTNALLAALERVERFTAMTGTLIAGRLDSCYPAIAALDQRYYPGGFSTFIAQHAEFIDEFNRVQGWVGLDKVKAILLRHAVRRTFEEVYGKESKVTRVEWCHMGPQIRAAYDEFHAQGLLELEDRWLDGSLPGVHFIRCRQIMEHPETMGLAEGEPIGKDERIRIHLEDARINGTAVVIFAALIPQQERLFELARSMGMTVAMMNGETDIQRERGRIDRAFQNGEYQVIIASPKVASVGFNWGHVDHIIFASLDWRDIDFLQAYRRAMRGVRDKPLRITILGYVKSVDVRIFEIIRNGSQLAHDVDPSREVFDFLADA